jgi:hypothetical protein
LQDAKNSHQAQAPHIQSEDLRLPAQPCENNELDFIFFANLSEPFKFQSFLARRNKGQSVSLINCLVKRNQALQFLSLNDFLPLFALI